MRIFTFLYGQNTLNKQTSALRLKKDWMGIPHARASGESLSSQGQLFVKQTSLLLLPERTHLFSRAESLPPLPERQMDRSTSYPMETPSFKISESVSCDKKNPLSTCGIHLAPVASPHGELRQKEPTRATLWGYRRSDFWCRDLTFLLRRERETNPDKLAC